MKFFIIAYAFKNPNKDASLLSKGLSSFPKSLKCLENTWLIGLEGNSRDVFNRINLLFEPGDRYIIIEAVKNYYGILQPSAWEWISENMV